MDRQQILLKLRNDLANQLGVEKTPAEVDDIVAQAVAVYDTVSIDVYRYLRDLTPGGCLMEARRHKFESINDFWAVRDIILLVGEHKYPSEAKRTDKPFLW